MLPRIVVLDSPIKSRYKIKIKKFQKNKQLINISLLIFIQLEYHIKNFVFLKILSLKVKRSSGDVKVKESQQKSRLSEWSEIRTIDV